MKKYMNYGGRTFAAGGAMPMEQLTEFNEGGRHEENSLGGIPQGMNPQGQMNLVEEGETKFDAENYIYSDSLKVDKELAEAFNLNPKMVGKTFADASKMAGRKKSKREGDAIEMAANEKDLLNLMEAQEAFKQARIEEKLQEIAELDPNALPALMGQGQDPNMMQDPAMGGQMQEAPMDEQAMIEQQMMAEQQAGGGQPSPEEMAMMQQQQDMMMGQQEGMMMNGGSLYNTMYGNGGKLPKEVLRARAQSHMSPAEADAYVNNYAKGGKMDFEPHMMYKDGNGIQANTYEKHLSLKNQGYGHTMGSGGYTTRSYAPGGFMGMNMANAGMVNPGPCAPEDCGTPGCPPCTGEPTPTEMAATNVTRPEIPSLSVRGLVADEGAKERNAAKLKEYEMQVRDRNSNMSRERGRLATIAKKQKLLKQQGGVDYDPAAMSARFAADKNFVKMSPESVKEFNRRNRGESGFEAPEVTELYRPKIGTYNRMPYADDQAFMDENFNREKKITTNYGPVYRTDFGDTTEKIFAEIPYPDMEFEGLEKLTPPRPSVEVDSLVGTEPAPEFVEPQGPGKIEYVKGKRSEKVGTAKQRMQNLGDRIAGRTKLKTGKIEGQKGYFRNLGEKRKYNKESELAKAYIDSGYDNTFIPEKSNLTEANAAREKDLREDRRSFIGAAFRNPFKGGLSAAMSTGKEIRDLVNAQKYSKDPMSSEYEYFTPEVVENYRASKNEFGGNLMQPVQPMQMRRGGKMCYGCGGAMHAYGGRMNGMNQMATGGEIISGIGSGLYGVGEGLLDTLTFGLTDELTDRGYEALQEIGPMKGEDNVGDAIRGGANVAGAATGAVLTGGAATGSAVSQGSKGTGDMLGAIGEETGNETLGKVGKGVEGAGQVAGMFIGGGGAGSAAGKAAEGAGTVAAGAGTLGAGAKVADAAKTAEAASKAAKAAKFAKVGEIASNKGVQAGVNLASTAIGSAEEKAEAERLAEEERMRIEREKMMTNDPTSPYYNQTARYGKKLYAGGGYMEPRSYGTGGGLWANIHAKRARIAAGSGEKMRKPGSKGAPTAAALKKSQNAMGGRLYNSGGYMYPMFAGPEINDEEVAGIINQTTNDDGTYGGDMDNAFIDMSMSANPTDLISPIYNIGMGLFGKSADTSYDVEQFNSIPFDFTETKNALRRQTAKAMNALTRKGTGNPSNILALTQIGAKLEADYLQKAQNINIQREQAAKDKNTVAKNAYEKQQKELQLKEKAIRDELIKTGLENIQSISDKNAQTEYMFKFMQAMAPDVVKGSYKNMSQMFMDIFKKKQKKSKS